MYGDQISQKILHILFLKIIVVLFPIEFLRSLFRMCIYIYIYIYIYIKYIIIFDKLLNINLKNLENHLN